MADEEINNSPEENEVSQEENQEETVNQEELAKQWEEQLANQETQENLEENTEETIDQEELAKQWEEALAQQAQQDSSDESKDETEAVNQEDLAKQWEEALAQQQSQSFSTDSSSSFSVDNDKLELILDIPLEITVEVGNKSIPLEDILKMTPNTIIELERYINEPVDIKVNGKLIAKGELYTVENNFGVKITSIITVQERMKLLMEEVE
ncbi:MAG TPA: flagellar motor switch protein FliN [Persephonella sp.]|nr:flagellar motor switch protein FliN [Hydrogenothermaceae bacterium]HIQ25032.1 flagellar motor switch protein FliN [Persephonella sp.]